MKDNRTYYPDKTYLEETDFYEFTAGNALISSNNDMIVEYDVFFRKAPWNGGYAIFAGLNHAIDFISNSEFLNNSRLSSFLNGKNQVQLEYPIFIRSIKEGSIVFPNEPILSIRGRNSTLMMLETPILSIINHESLIATKAHRITYGGMGLAYKRKIFEFGSRRAHGLGAAANGAYAAYIGGITATSNVCTSEIYNIPVFGTMQHAFVQSFNTESEAFDKYTEFSIERNLPTILLIDTYDVYKGIKNAINTFKKYEEKLCHRFVDYGIRIDSGDLAKLSKEMRRILDQEGFERAIIVVSNDLDEYLIDSLEKQDCKIDAYGVGTSLITAKGCSDFGGVYKLTAKYSNHTRSDVFSKDYEPVIKCSENIDKTTIPGPKEVFSIYKKDEGSLHYIADIIFLLDEFVHPENMKEFFAFDLKTNVRYKIKLVSEKTMLVRKTSEEICIGEAGPYYINHDRYSVQEIRMNSEKESENYNNLYFVQLAGLLKIRMSNLLRYLFL